MGFAKSAGLGKFAENKVVELFAQAGIKAELTDKKLIEHDIKFTIDGVDYYAEVKFDIMAQRTGNLAIEYHNTKKDSPSGILATKSHIWVVVLQDPLGIWITNTKQLRRYFDDVKCLRDVKGGDKNSAMRLYKKEDILTIFTDFLGLTPDSISKTLKQILGK